MVERAVSLADIRTALADGFLVLVLLDKRHIRCPLCVKSWQPRLMFPSPGFLGHYVLVYAYHQPSDRFLVKDPSSAGETCVLSSEVLEQARLAFGTDQDILFIGDVASEEEEGKSSTLQRNSSSNLPQIATNSSSLRKNPGKMSKNNSQNLNPGQDKS